MSFSLFSAILMTFVVTFFLSFSSFAQLTDGTSTTTLPSSWGVSFFSIGSMTQKQIERGGGSFGSYNYLGLNYKLSKAKRLSARPAFYYNTNGINKFNEYNSQSMETGDFHFVYSDYEFAAFENADIEVILNFKVYLPTSQFSQATRLVAKIRPEVIVSKPVGRFSSLSYVAKPDIYIQSQMVYVDETTPKRADGRYRFDPRTTTSMANLEHFLEFDASLTPAFSIKPALGFSEAWYNSSESDGLPGGHTTVARLALAMEFRVGGRASVTFGVENKPKVTNRKDDVALFRPEENEATLMINASM